MLGGREYLEYLPRKCGLCIWHICRHYVEKKLLSFVYCICRFRFIYGYSNVQQLYFAIWFSSSFLLDLHPSTPGGFCRHWQEDGAATRAKERAIAADKRGQVIFVSTNCAISPCETPVGMIQGLGMEEVMMIPWKRRFVVRSDIDESCLASPSGTHRMGKYSVHRLHHQDCKEYYWDVGNCTSFKVLCHAFYNNFFRNMQSSVGSKANIKSDAKLWLCPLLRWRAYFRCLFWATFCWSETPNFRPVSVALGLLKGWKAENLFLSQHQDFWSIGRST